MGAAKKCFLIMKILLLIFFYPICICGQILYSESVPFQYLSKESTPQKVYELLLTQEVFEDLKITDYTSRHKKIALLPINLIYSDKKTLSLDNNVSELELLTARCLSENLITDFKEYSQEMLKNQKSLNHENNSSSEYVPQTQIDKYLNNIQKSDNNKVYVYLQDYKTTIKTLSAINNSKLYDSTPESLCELLGVDAIIYIHIISDFFIPIKNCFKTDESNNTDVSELHALYDLLKLDNLAKESVHATKSILKDKKVTSFISIYDSSGKLIWLHGNIDQANNVLNSIIENNAKTIKKWHHNTFFSNTFPLLPYLLN